MRSAPFSAPCSEAGSGPSTHRIIPAPRSTSARLPRVAPAASNSASDKDAPSPAPRSTATSAPSATNFFTVSGIAAQRVSPSAVSLSTAIFIWPELLQDKQDDEADREAG